MKYIFAILFFLVSCQSNSNSKSAYAGDYNFSKLKGKIIKDVKYIDDENLFYLILEDGTGIKIDIYKYAPKVYEIN